jgi:hypothetical protein
MVMYLNDELQIKKGRQAILPAALLVRLLKSEILGL